MCRLVASVSARVSAVVVAAVVATALAAWLVIQIVHSPAGGFRPSGAEPRSVPAHAVPLGAFLGSGAEGVAAVAGFQAWLGAPVTVGHTYLPGATWSDVEGEGGVLTPWAQWTRAHRGRTLVLNVPMLVPNEPAADSDTVRGLLARGAGGQFDEHFRALARRMVAEGVPTAHVLLGWEMNGISYTGRCGPDPGAWKAYWRRIVAAMRSVPGARFSFDFTPDRGIDDVPWHRCYPGDDVVDVLAMDSYDQAPGHGFADYVGQPGGLGDQAAFAEAHHKPMAFPEWGLRRYGDRPQFVRDMHEWIATHDVAYQTVTDYCPSGVWECRENPRSTSVYRELFGG
jgi:hypothetical protein